MTKTTRTDRRDSGGSEQLHVEVGSALAQLTPMEEQVLRLHFGISAARQDVDRLSELLGVTRARLRELERSALQKLRAATLQDFHSHVRRPSPRPGRRATAACAQRPIDTVTMRRLNRAL